MINKFMILHVKYINKNIFTAQIKILFKVINVIMYKYKYVEREEKR